MPLVTAVAPEAPAVIAAAASVLATAAAAVTRATPERRRNWLPIRLLGTTTSGLGWGWPAGCPGEFDVRPRSPAHGDRSAVRALCRVRSEKTVGQVSHIGPGLRRTAHNRRRSQSR